jgi:hypothetical protein
MKPIETAPKDRRILVYVPDADNNPITSGWFSAQWNHFSKQWTAGFVTYIDECAEPAHPTLWCELPELPQEYKIKNDIVDS